MGHPPGSRWARSASRNKTGTKQPRIQNALTLKNRNMIHLSPKLTKVKHVLSVLVLLLLRQITFAQDHQTINGVITDARNKEPLAGATVKLEGTTYATATDAQGAYTINAAVKDGTYTLTISFAGYKPMIKTITLNHSPVTVSTPLAENALSLGEVVVTGTTIAVTKKQLGNAISTVSGADLNKGLATS